MDSLHYKLSQELGIQSQQVTAVATLLEDGNTIPFIARYRKEATGSLTDEYIAKIDTRLGELKDLEKRKVAIRKSLDERDLLSAELQQKIYSATNITNLEDIYLPFRPKRRTRAEIAREKGLEPLAKIIFTFRNEQPLHAHNFINDKTEVHSVEDALAGACDIIAEWINENIIVRERLRNLFAKRAIITAVGDSKARDADKFSNYFNHQENVQKIAGHRILALFRGEATSVLKISVRPDASEALDILKSQFSHKDCTKKALILKAIEDSYKRLLAPSLENELRAKLKKQADAEAIAVFVANFRKLLLSPALGAKRVLALDPGFRTGAKLVCLGAQGELLAHTTIFPLLSEQKAQEAHIILNELVTKHKIEAIAIGNGTAGRETESFVRDLFAQKNVLITMVNESGASVYSASPLAREEFPDHDVTVRGAISIGRRLQDPLAELVKIDPKAIGVGQYQHDVHQAELKSALEETVIQCVNQVGVHLNTASYSLLSFVSGIGPALAKNIVVYRDEIGMFKNRKELQNVPRLGAKAYEQAAGFMRIMGGKNTLDSTAVHPEQYKVVEQMAKDNKVSIDEFIQNTELRRTLSLEKYTSEKTGLITLKDIMEELDQPGRDPRAEWSQFSFTKDIDKITDLTPEMILPGIVTNVTAFGAFVDIGVHQDGLIHISQLANRFIKEPSDVVQVQQEVKVRVLEVDVKRKRIALSLKDVPQK